MTKIKNWKQGILFALKTTYFELEEWNRTYCKKSLKVKTEANEKLRAETVKDSRDQRDTWSKEFEIIFGIKRVT